MKYNVIWHTVGVFNNYLNQRSVLLPYPIIQDYLLQFSILQFNLSTIYYQFARHYVRGVEKNKIQSDVVVSGRACQHKYQQI